MMDSHHIHKVNRCLARYSPRTTTTNQPTNRAPNEPARSVCAQESMFWGKNGCFWAKHPNYLGGSKSSGTHLSENHQGTSFAFFGRAWHRMKKKGQCTFVVKFVRFWAQILIFWRGGKSFGTHISENQLGTSFPLFFGWALHQNGSKRQILGPKRPKMSILGQVVNIFNPEVWSRFGRWSLVEILKLIFGWLVTWLNVLKF